MDENNVISGVNIKVTPKGGNNVRNRNEDNILKSAMNIANEMFGDDEEEVIEEETVKKDKNFLQKFLAYVKSGQLKEDIKEQAKKHKLPPKQLAKNFFTKVLGILSDIGAIVLNTVCTALDAIIDGISLVLHGAVAVIHKVASAIGRLFTLNQTNKQPETETATV